MIKHTPGHWKEIYVKAIGGEDGTAYGWVVIKRVGKALDVRANSSDMRLMTAAPELLEACKIAESYILYRDDILEKLRAAIRKAEGSET
jgi:hypothetical protein